MDIYYEHNLPNDHHLYFDLVGTFINSSNDRRFEQTPLGETVADTTDVTSRVRGNKYSLIGKAIYEKDWENIALTVDVRYNYHWTKNLYKGQSDQG